MKNGIVTGILLCAFATGALAETARIGFVDTERILRESEPALAAQKLIDKEFSVREQEVKALAKQLQDAKENLESARAKLSDSTRRIQEREIDNLNLLLQTRQRELREDLSLRQNEELARILARADQAIRQIAETEQYDFILQEAVYRSPKVDITDKVLKYLAGEQTEPAER
ncbi:OmpH family outer membrane protein [Ferrigenium sp. UT5]|uniref:OmpH family outer membrane protein n=1 Tax=Ferrigenium sp. UT5 TaxID=3242105 RepID=UPI00354FFC12